MPGRCASFHIIGVNCLPFLDNISVNNYSIPAVLECSLRDEIPSPNLWDQMMFSFFMMFESTDAWQTTFRKRKISVFVLSILNLGCFRYWYSLWLHRANRSGFESHMSITSLVTVTLWHVCLYGDIQCAAEQTQTISSLCSQWSKGELQSDIIWFPSCVLAWFSITPEDEHPRVLILDSSLSLIVKFVQF